MMLYAIQHAYTIIHHPFKIRKNPSLAKMLIPVTSSAKETESNNLFNAGKLHGGSGADFSGPVPVPVHPIEILRNPMNFNINPIKSYGNPTESY
jgi:hypothetical protein